MRFGNKAGYNQLMIQDSYKPVSRPKHSKAELSLALSLAFFLGFLIALYI